MVDAAVFNEPRLGKWLLWVGVTDYTGILVGRPDGHDAGGVHINGDARLFGAIPMGRTRDFWSVDHLSMVVALPPVLACLHLRHIRRARGGSYGRATATRRGVKKKRLHGEASLKWRGASTR